jgi:nucleotide-binding universal stress UspA family protein
MFERIVLAVDGSYQTRGAIAAAIDHATAQKGEVLIVHVLDTGRVTGEAIDPETQVGARLLTEAALNVVTSAGVTARCELRAAPSAEIPREILHAAREFEADAIVVGSRGHGDFAGLLLGSVAHKVIQLADCPVVVVRAGAAAAAARKRGQEKAASAA